MPALGAFQADGRGGTAFLGEDWGKRTAPGDEMALALGVARDVSVKREIEHNERRPVAGNLFEQRVVLRYEVENFKSDPVTLDVVENVRRVRDELVGRRSNGQAHGVQWELGPKTSFPGGVDPEKTNADVVTLHAPLPGAAKGGKAAKQVLRLHLVLKNEW